MEKGVIRPEKELWQIILQNEDLFTLGLCGWVHNVEVFGKITADESFLLEKAILKGESIKRKSYWIGKMGKIQPRIDWIKERIKQL